MADFPSALPGRGKDDRELWLERALMKGLASPEAWPEAPAVPGQIRLSRRELEIVQFLAAGLRNFEIAEQLSLAEQTVKNHLHKIFQKTGVRDRLEMALYAVYHRMYVS
jgi:DNA-binding NarL/FixJ family response regulator